MENACRQKFGWPSQWKYPSQFCDLDILSISGKTGEILKPWWNLVGPVVRRLQAPTQPGKLRNTKKWR